MPCEHACGSIATLHTLTRRLRPAPHRRSTLNGRSVPKRFRGDGKTVYRHSLRVWDLPNVTLASELITGEGAG